MNSIKKKSPAVRGVAQPVNRRLGGASQFRPVVAQLKTSAVAPPVYRPQAVPKVLQLKRHEVKKPGGIVEVKNAVRSPSIPPAPAKILQRKASPDVHRHRATPTNLTARSPATANPCCVQAKANHNLRNNSFTSVPTARFANVVRNGRSIQLAAAKAAAAAPMDVEEDEAELKGELKEGASPLIMLAKALHSAGGGSSQKTTAVALLKNGKFVVSTQLSVATIGKAAAKFGITEVARTKGAGYHCEVSLYIDYGNQIDAIGASQPYCPHCVEFLLAKNILMVGPPRGTVDQVWYSPEYYQGIEKDPIGAAYPWAFLKDPVDHERVLYPTRAAYAAVYKKRTGKDLP